MLLHDLIVMVYSESAKQRVLFYRFKGIKSGTNEIMLKKRELTLAKYVCGRLLSDTRSTELFKGCQCHKYIKHLKKVIPGIIEFEGGPPVC